MFNCRPPVYFEAHTSELHNLFSGAAKTKRLRFPSNLSALSPFSTKIMLRSSVSSQKDLDQDLHRHLEHTQEEILELVECAKSMRYLFAWFLDLCLVYYHYSLICASSLIVIPWFQMCQICVSSLIVIPWSWSEQGCGLHPGEHSIASKCAGILSLVVFGRDSLGAICLKVLAAQGWAFQFVWLCWGGESDDVI